MSADDSMLGYLAGLPVPDLGATPFTTPIALADAQVAIVTTAGLHPPGHDEFGWFDSSSRVFSSKERDLRLSHYSPNFDRTGVLADLNVVYPVDRLDELAAQGVIGRVAPSNISFMGAQRELDVLLHDTGRRAAALLREEGTNVVLLTPI